MYGFQIWGSTASNGRPHQNISSIYEIDAADIQAAYKQSIYELHVYSTLEEAEEVHHHTSTEIWEYNHYHHMED